MSFVQAEFPAKSGRLEQTLALFGGKTRLRRKISSPLEAHEMLGVGLPNAALAHFLDQLIILRRDESLGRAIGMSLRTLQRRKHAPDECLDREQSGRVWKFAEILARAGEVLGGQGPAEQWIEAPALGLSGWRPLDLLATPAGLAIVEEHLDRLEYGVYV